MKKINSTPNTCFSDKRPQEMRPLCSCTRTSAEPTSSCPQLYCCTNWNSNLETEFLSRKALRLSKNLIPTPPSLCCSSLLLSHTHHRLLPASVRILSSWKPFLQSCWKRFLIAFHGLEIGKIFKAQFYLSGLCVFPLLSSSCKQWWQQWVWSKECFLWDWWLLLLGSHWQGESGRFFLDFLKEVIEIRWTWRKSFEYRLFCLRSAHVLHRLLLQFWMERRKYFIACDYETTFFHCDLIALWEMAHLLLLLWLNFDFS